MVSGDALRKTGKCPCAVCYKGVGCNSIECSQCKLWLLKKCSGITIQLVKDLNYICPRCKGESLPVDGRPMTQVDVEFTSLDVDATFCYVGDMPCSGGTVTVPLSPDAVRPGESSRTYCRSSRGNVNTACVCSAMLHGSDTWGPNTSDLEWLRRKDRAMIRWIVAWCCQPLDGTWTAP